MHTVLIADDDPEILNILSIWLTSCGYSVQRATNGYEALAQVATQRPAVILMDLNMPGISGWEATARLKQDPTTAAIPIVAITAHGLGHALDRAWAAGIDDFLCKPLDLDVLQTTVREHIEAQTAAPALKEPTA